MTFYSEMAEMADELLREFGDVNEMLLIREVPIDSTSASPDPPVQYDYKVKGVLQLRYRYLDGVESSSLIEEHKRGLMLSTFMQDGRVLPIKPKSGDKISIQEDGEAVIWKVGSAAPVAPGGTAIIHKLEITK